MNKKTEYNRAYFRGKTAVVTGAASGIGLALAEELLQSNAAKIMLADIHQERLDEHVKRLQEQYGDCVKGMLCNVTLEEEVQSLISRSADFFDGKLDLLFNNAGALFSGWFDEVTNEKWKDAFDLNFYGALYGMRAVLPIMKKQGGGQIINVISGTAFTPMAQWSPYATTKAALNALTVAVRAEYWDDGIKISAATPGTTATNIFGDNKPAGGSMQTPHQSASRILRGVVNNDRIIYGDDPDRKGAKNCFAYHAQKGKDAYLLRVARERRKGVNAI
ncbi:MAG: SDR family oxidoreductase [Clostridia bacterium]|nr:SDR family oxidoreductase [Clostridia bacterium]